VRILVRDRKRLLNGLNSPSRKPGKRGGHITKHTVSRMDRTRSLSTPQGQLALLMSFTEDLTAHGLGRITSLPSKPHGKVGQDGMIRTARPTTRTKCLPHRTATPRLAPGLPGGASNSGKRLQRWPSLYQPLPSSQSKPGTRRVTSHSLRSRCLRSQNRHSSLAATRLVPPTKTVACKHAHALS